MTISSRFSRKKTQRPSNKVFFIVCCGRRTEKDYFESFKIKDSPCSIIVKICDKNPKKILEYTEKILCREGLRDYSNKEVWLVFDRDSFPDFDETIEKTTSKQFNFAVSNKCFEIWYCLHYKYSTAVCSCEEAESFLSKQLGFEYKKDRCIYKELFPFQSKAILNAEKLEHFFSDQSKKPSEKEPWTTVYKLVKNINVVNVPKK